MHRLRFHRKKDANNDKSESQTSRSIHMDDENFLPKAPNRNETVLSDASGSFDKSNVWDKKAILSLDGGGIRGYSALLIIHALMQAIGELESKYQGQGGSVSSSYHPLPSTVPAIANDLPRANAPISSTSQWLPCHYFDYMAGTSTGGLISIMIGRLRMTIDDCISNYETLGKEVFGKSRSLPIRLFKEKYDHKILQKVVEDVVNRNAPKIAGFPGGRSFAFDENRCRVVAVAYQESMTGELSTAYLFRTYNNLRQRQNPMLDRNPSPAHDIPIWEVARATSAAPGFFKPITINGLQYVDGGYGETNNPSEEIFDEVRMMNNYVKNPTSIFISIGTGLNHKMKRTSRSKLATGRLLKAAKFAKNLITNSEIPHKRMLKRLDDSPDLKYYRFNVEEGLAEMKLDEWRTRGKLRVGTGKWVGKCRKKLTPTKQSRNVNSEKAEYLRHLSGRPSEESNSTTASAGHTNEDRLLIPSFLQPYDTIQNIKDLTKKYLEDTEIQRKIKECAKILVEERRERARTDPQRWERSCFKVWYQCRVKECPRGEKIYPDRDALKQHLLDKHRGHFRPGGDIDEGALKKALDEYKIIVQ